MNLHSIEPALTDAHKITWALNRELGHLGEYAVRHTSNKRYPFQYRLSHWAQTKWGALTWENAKYWLNRYEAHHPSS